MTIQRIAKDCNIDKIFAKHASGEVLLDETQLSFLIKWLDKNDSKKLQVLLSGCIHFESRGMRGFTECSRKVAMYQGKILIVYEACDRQNVYVNMEGDVFDDSSLSHKPIAVIINPTQTQIKKAVQENQELIDKENNRK